MHIEEKMDFLIEQNKFLAERIEELEKRERPEEFVTPKQLAEMMDCSTNTIYIKIRSGEINAVHIGACPKIPMSQFYIGKEEIKLPEKKSRKKPEQREKSIKEFVFG